MAAPRPPTTTRGVAMTVDLEDRLSALFDRVAGTVTVAEDLDRVRSIDPRHRRTWLPAVAATVVMLAGVGAIVSITIGDDPDRSVSQQPAEPAGPLYVLPDGLDGSSVGNGSMGSAQVEPHRGIVVATPDGDGFVDPVAVQVSTQPAGDTESSLPPDEEFSFPVVASVPQGDMWLSADRRSAVGAASAGKRRGRRRRHVDTQSRVAVDGARDLRQPRTLRVALHLLRGDARIQRPRRGRDRQPGRAPDHPHRGWEHPTRNATRCKAAMRGTARAPTPTASGTAWRGHMRRSRSSTCPGTHRSTRCARSPRASTWSTRRHGSRRPGATAEPPPASTPNRAATQAHLLRRSGERRPTFACASMSADNHGSLVPALRRVLPRPHASVTCTPVGLVALGCLQALGPVAPQHPASGLCPGRRPRSPWRARQGGQAAGHRICPGPLRSRLRIRLRATRGSTRRGAARLPGAARRVATIPGTSR